ncbi:MAG: pyridoxal phosphate-dependent aminotransferase [Chloroflexi bacterium]|nr:pyridoxal phosphate-dependent aminotransferase [Chloroflexota bacterium]
MTLRAATLNSPTAAAVAERAAAWGPLDAGSGWPRCIAHEGQLDLSADYGDTTLPEAVVKTVEDSLLRGETHYTDRPGLPALREAVARKLAADLHIHVDWRNEVVISCGEQEGVFLALQVLIRPGDEVLAPDPRPEWLDESVRLARGVLTAAPLLPKDGFELKAEQIAARLTDRSRVLVLVQPSNPTGAAISAGELGRIAALAADRNLTIIADEALDESFAGQARHTSIASLPEAAGRTIVVGSFSKFFGLASWRVGYFAGPKDAVTTIRDMKQAMTICTSAMAQYAALAMLTQVNDWLTARRNALDQAREIVLAALDALGLPHPARGGLADGRQASPYVFADVRPLRAVSALTGGSSVAFADWLRTEAEVTVAPGSRFGLGGEGFVRISLWPPLSDLEQAMRRLRWAAARAQAMGGVR